LQREHDRARGVWGAALRAVATRKFGAEACDRMFRPTLSTGPGFADLLVRM